MSFVSSHRNVWVFFIYLWYFQGNLKMCHIMLTLITIKTYIFKESCCNATVCDFTISLLNKCVKLKLCFKLINFHKFQSTNCTVWIIIVNSTYVTSCCLKIKILAASTFFWWFVAACQQWLIWQNCCCIGCKSLSK